MSEPTPSGPPPLPKDGPALLSYGGGLNDEEVHRRRSVVDAVLALSLTLVLPLGLAVVLGFVALIASAFAAVFR
jgi:hypothetical protein